MASEGRHAAIGAAKTRTEVLEYGHTPVCPWLANLSSFVSLQSLLRDLLRRGQYTADGCTCFVPLAALVDALGATLQQTQVLLDLLAAVSDEPAAVAEAPGGDGAPTPAAVDAHRLALFLFAQFYTRDVVRVDTADVWPPDHPSATQQEPSSPMRLAARAWAREQPAHHRAPAHLPATRAQMQEYMAWEEGVITGFGTFLARHATEAVALAAAGGPGAGGSGLSEGEDIFEPSASDMGGDRVLSAAEIDRLGFLIAVDEGGGGGGGQDEAAAMEAESGGVMDMDDDSPAASPFGGGGSAAPAARPLSARLPRRLWAPDGSGVPAGALEAWLRESLAPADAEPGRSADVSMISASPPRVSMFDQLAPPVLSLLTPLDVCGLHRATALRGESDVAAAGAAALRIVDCHDAVVYCLAPLQYASVSCCTDCVVVLGAAARAVRLDRCERVQVVAAAARVVVSTCHDCILYLAVSRPPLLVGDNRFLQLAPHNAGYDLLGEHVLRAGVRAAPRAWAAATPLLPDQSAHAAATRYSNALIAGGGAYGTSPPLAGSGGGGVNSGGAGGGQKPTSPVALSPLKVPSPRSPSLGPGSGGGSPTAAGAAAAGAEAPAPGQPPAATLLPPHKLFPFLVPFTGGPGPLCGGPARQRASAAASFSGAGAAGDEDPLGGMIGGAGGSGAEAFGPSPFPLPPEFAAAWEDRVGGMAAVRSAYRAAGLGPPQKREFIGAIQAHFKEWLQAGSGMRMREVYDLAKAEKEGTAGTGAAAGGMGGSPM